MVESGREAEKPRGGGTEFRLFQRTEVRSLPGGGREARLGPARKPIAVITYDAAGRVLKVEHEYTLGNSGQSVHAVEVATWRDGHLTAIEMRKNGEAPQQITFSEEALPDGGRKLMWVPPGAAEGQKSVLTYDAKGRLASYSPAPKTAAEAAFRFEQTLEYNEHGDPVALTQRRGTNTAAAERFSYEYDAAGNWIRRQRFTVSAGKTEPQEVDVRRIHYGGGAPVAARSRPGATPSSRPAGNAAAAAAGAVSPGTYRVVRQEKGSVFTVEMTLELKPDRTARYSIVTALKGPGTERSLAGTWQPYDKGVAVAFTKTGDGKPVPEQMRTMRFMGNDSGGLVPERDRATTFEPVSPSPAKAPTTPTATPTPPKANAGANDDGLD